MSFSHLVGQDDLRSALKGSLARGETGHATLFTGPAGSGKKSWGTALARALLCSRTINGEACLSCLSCRSFPEEKNPAFLLVQPKGKSLKIEQFREARPFFQLTGMRRVCLIENASSMTAPAASSLLVTLEEPSDELFFILLADRADLLFSTIHSRCRHYRLKAMKPGEITAVLRGAGHGSHERLDVIARISGGLPGRALKAAGDPDFESRLSMATELAENLAGGSKPLTEYLDIAEDLSARDDLPEVLQILAVLLRELLVRAYGSSEELRLSPGWNPAGLQRVNLSGLEEAVIIINSALKDLATINVNRRLLVLSTIVLIQRRLAVCP